MSGQDDEEILGFIFMCNSITKPQCYQYRVFGLPFGRWETAKKVKCGAKLFLYDFQVKLLYGIYEATSSGYLNIQPDAFDGRFPSQVSFKIYKDCLPLQENVFKHAIHENFNGTKFRQELNSEQVKSLIELFRPINLAATHSRELHQQSLPPPQVQYYSGMQQTGHLQDSAYFYEQQYGRLMPQHYGTRVPIPHSETQIVYVHPPYLPQVPHLVTEPYKRDGSSYFHGNQQQLPQHHAIAAAAQVPQIFANPSKSTWLEWASPSYHYNAGAAQSAVQSQTYAVPHHGDGANPGCEIVSKNEANYYAPGAYPGYSGHVVANDQPYNNTSHSMYHKHPPSYGHWHHEAAVGCQFQVHEHANQTGTQTEPNVPFVSSQNLTNL